MVVNPEPYQQLNTSESSTPSKDTLTESSNVLDSESASGGSRQESSAAEQPVTTGLKQPSTTPVNTKRTFRPGMRRASPEYETTASAGRTIPDHVYEDRDKEKGRYSMYNVTPAGSKYSSSNLSGYSMDSRYSASDEPSSSFGIIPGRSEISEDGVRATEKYKQEGHKAVSAWHRRGGRQPVFDNPNEIFEHESARSSSAAFAFDIYEKTPVSLTGNDTDNMTAFGSFCDNESINAQLRANISRVGYEKPSPIQNWAIPVMLAGRDLMACAQTGSGKTAAFLIPIINDLLEKGPPEGCSAKDMRQRSQRQRAKPLALIVSPTRELAVQIYDEARKFCFSTGVRAVAIFGGASAYRQQLDLQRGVDICVATPGRLADFYHRGTLSLSACRYLVLDEADRMLDMGFAPKIQEIIEQFDMPDVRFRQAVMFSATFPREIQKLALEYLYNYVYLTVGKVGSSSDFVDQQLRFVEEGQKFKVLLKILRDSLSFQEPRILVFVGTKIKAEQLEKELNAAQLESVSIHGDRKQQDRRDALNVFKSGRVNICVATDVAARGLDIPMISVVVNYDLPTHIDDYVHRIGRTGRAGNRGTAIAFVNEGNRQIFKDLSKVLSDAHQETPDWFNDMVNRLGGAGNSQKGGYQGSSGMRSDDIGRYSHLLKNRDQRLDALPQANWRTGAMTAEPAPKPKAFMSKSGAPATSKFINRDSVVKTPSVLTEEMSNLSIDDGDDDDW